MVGTISTRCAKCQGRPKGEQTLQKQPTSARGDPRVSVESEPRPVFGAVTANQPQKIKKKIFSDKVENATNVDGIQTRNRRPVSSVRLCAQFQKFGANCALLRRDGRPRRNFFSERLESDRFLPLIAAWKRLDTRWVSPLARRLPPGPLAPISPSVNMEVTISRR